MNKEQNHISLDLLLVEIARKDFALQVALDTLNYLQVTAEHRVDTCIPMNAILTIEQALK